LLNQHHVDLEALVARFLAAHPDKLPSQTSVLELVVWSGSNPDPLTGPLPCDLPKDQRCGELWCEIFRGVDPSLAPPKVNVHTGGRSPETPQTLASEAKQARDSIASSAQALAPGSIASQRLQGGPAMPMPPPAPKGFTPPAPRPSTSPQYSNSCAHAPNRLQDYGAGSICQDCNTVFPTYKRAT
jgi:hypothetical protein